MVFPWKFVHFLVITLFPQETIIVSEYLRALKLKSDGRKEDAIKLFSELLEAEALDQVCVCNFFFRASTNQKKFFFVAGHQM